jgi:hypothetical protein
MQKVEMSKEKKNSERFSESVELTRRRYTYT